MPRKSMASYAKDWKSPEQRREAKRDGADKASMKNSPDSKGPGPNDWKKGATKTPKGC